MSELPVIFLAHGGGPLPILGAQPEIAEHLRDIPSLIPSGQQPKAIVSNFLPSFPLFLGWNEVRNNKTQSPQSHLRTPGGEGRESIPSRPKNCPYISTSNVI
jgi:hypothetical protein